MKRPEVEQLVCMDDVVAKKTRSRRLRGVDKKAISSRLQGC